MKQMKNLILFIAVLATCVIARADDYSSFINDTNKSAIMKEIDVIYRHEKGIQIQLGRERAGVLKIDGKEIACVTIDLWVWKKPRWGKVIIGGNSWFCVFINGEFRGVYDTKLMRRAVGGDGRM